MNRERETRETRETRERNAKACKQVMVGLSFTSNWLRHRAQRSQIRLQIRSFFTVQIELVGAKLQTVNIRDLMTRNANFFHSGDDPFTSGYLGVFFGKLYKAQSAE